jgi:integrase
MYTVCTLKNGLFRNSVLGGMKLFTRHACGCKHRKDRNYNRCACPIWVYDPDLQRGKQRYSAGTNDWDEAMRTANKIQQTPARIKKNRDLNIVHAVEMYLVKRSKKAKHADGAPYPDRWLLRDGSKRQPSLLQWAAENGFEKLEDITSIDVEQWRNSWVFREGSYSLKINNHVIKAFFTWAVRFDLLEKNPFDKLDKLKIVPVPTLPLTTEEYAKMLARVPEACGRHADTVTTLIWLMRWSGLSILDACSLRRDRLDAQNRLQTHRQKTGEFVHVKLPNFVADALRAHKNGLETRYFFWDGRTDQKANSRVKATWIRKVYDKAGITPRGCHRFRDTFAVEFLNSGGTIENLAMLMGHSKIATTQEHYMPWVKSRQKVLDDAVDQSIAVQLASQRYAITTISTAVN